MKLTYSRGLRTIYQATEGRLLVGSGPVLFHPRNKRNFVIYKTWKRADQQSVASGASLLFSRTLSGCWTRSRTQAVQTTFCLEQERLAPATTQFVLQYFRKCNFQCINQEEISEWTKWDQNISLWFQALLLSWQNWSVFFFSKEVLHRNLLFWRHQNYYFILPHNTKELFFCKTNLWNRWLDFSLTRVSTVKCYHHALIWRRAVLLLPTPWKETHTHLHLSTSEVSQVWKPTGENLRVRTEGHIFFQY